MDLRQSTTTALTASTAATRGATGADLALRSAEPGGGGGTSSSAEPGGDGDSLDVLGSADPGGGGPAVPALRGRGLRFVIVGELMRRPSMTVEEMVVTLRRYGYRLGGRASKTISDALRWEVRRGRVRRPGRGVYRYHRAPATTARRIRLFAQRCHTWVVAMTRTGNPPEVPPNRRPGPKAHLAHPGQPPWSHLGWLWTS